MPLCGSYNCGCAMQSVPASSGEIDGFYPTLDVAGGGEPGSPWNLTLDENWAAQVADAVNGLHITRQVGDVTQPQNTTAAWVDLSGTALAVNLVQGYRYRLTGRVMVGSSAVDYVQARILVGATGVGATAWVCPVANTYALGVVDDIYDHVAASGPVTISLQYGRAAGAGNVGGRHDIMPPVWNLYGCGPIT